MLQLAPFSFPASVSSQSRWLPSKAKLYLARQVPPDTLQTIGSIKESAWCQTSWRVSVLKSKGLLCWDTSGSPFNGNANYSLQGGHEYTTFPKLV